MISLKALADALCPELEMAEKTPIKKAGVYTDANRGDLHELARSLGKLHNDHDVECPGCHRYDPSNPHRHQIGPSTKVPGTSAIQCLSKTCAGHKGGTFTYVDAYAGWHGISEEEAVKRLSSKPANDSEPFGIKWLGVDELFAPQTDAAYLVKDLGIAPGAPTFLVGQGGVGKTMAAMALGISIVTGQPIWGTNWKPSRTGKVAHLDYEMGARLDALRLQRMALGMGVSVDELRGKWRTAAFPPIKLTNKRALDFLCYAFDGLALAILDSARAMMPGVEENSSQVRDYLDLCAVASEKTGCVPLIIHHAGKTDIRGTKARKEMGRGSSAFFDAASSYFVMTGEKASPFLLTHDKNREQGTYQPDTTLQIKDLPNGGLIVCPAAAGVVASPGAASLTILKESVLSVLRQSPDEGMSGAAVAKHLRIRPSDVKVAFEELMRDGKIVHNGVAGSKGRWLANPIN